MKTALEELEEQLKGLGYVEDSILQKIVNKLKEKENFMMIYFFHQGNHTSHNPNTDPVSLDGRFRNALERFKSDKKDE